MATPSLLGKAHLKADVPTTPPTSSSKPQTPFNDDEEDDEFDQNRQHNQPPRQQDLRPETALLIQRPTEKFDTTGTNAYVAACRMNRMPPSRRVMLQLLQGSSTLDCAHYGLGPLGTRCLSIPIVLNSTITTLSVNDNNIGVEGLEVLCTAVRESVSITALDLSDNGLGSQGAVVLANFLAKNHNIKSMNLAGNGFIDADARVLCEPLSQNKILQALDLSHNKFNVDCGEAFEKLLSTNETLRELDLSWNAIRLGSVRFVCRGLRNNITLEAINLAWNGLGPSDAREIVALLQSPARLLQVDLSSNRIPPGSFPAIARALLANETIESFRYGYNPVAAKDAKDLLRKLLQTPEQSQQLKQLWLMGVFFDADFEALVEELRVQRDGQLQIVYGYNDLYGKRKLKGYNPATEAMEIIKAFLVQHNVKLVDLFAEFDEDGSMSVSYDEFKLGLKKAGIPLSEQQVDCLIKELDADGDGDIDFSEFAIGAEGGDED